MTKAQQMERNEAIDRLRGWLKPGDTVYTCLRSVSRSGMTRNITAHKIERNSYTGLYLSSLSYNVAKALEWKDGENGIRVSGRGMDMGFHLVYTLSRVLFPHGFKCIGEKRRCPSNDHSNPGGTYAKGTKHSDGGYALRQEWI